MNSPIVIFDAEFLFVSILGSCEISDYRPMLRELVRGKGLPVLVYSGDVDAQIPHVATERWTRAMGFGLRCGHK